MSICRRGILLSGLRAKYFISFTIAHFFVMFLGVSPALLAEISGFRTSNIEEEYDIEIDEIAETAALKGYAWTNSGHAVLVRTL
jgi:hypothetical protein